MMQNLIGKLTCRLKNDIKSLVNFHQNKFSLKSIKTGTSMGPFCSKKKMYELKIYRGVMCHDNEE